MDLSNAHFTPSLSVSLFVHAIYFRPSHQRLNACAVRPRRSISPWQNCKRNKPLHLSRRLCFLDQPNTLQMVLSFSGGAATFPDKFRASSNIHNGRRYMPMGQNTWISREAQDAVCNYPLEQPDSEQANAMEDCKLVVFCIPVRWCHLNKSAFHGARSPYRDGHYDLNATKEFCAPGVQAK
jgi:hypothetical protein